MKVAILAAAVAALGLMGAAPAPHGYLLVSAKQAHALSIVDPQTLKVVARMPDGEDPHEVIVGPDGKTAYVSNFGEGALYTIQRIDLVHARTLKPLDLHPLQGPHGMAFDGGTLWFTADRSKALGQVDPVTGKITGVVGLGEMRTHMLWIAPDGAKVLASNAGSGTLSILDRTTLGPTIVPGAPKPPAAYTGQGWRHTLVPVGQAAEGFDVSPDRREAWVGNDDGSISIVDLAAEKVVDTVQAGVKGANRLKFTPDGRRVVVTTHTGPDLVVLDARTRQVVKRVPIEQRGASGIQMQPDGKRVYIACPRDHYVAVVDLETLQMVGKIDAGREPDGLAWWNR